MGLGSGSRQALVGRDADVAHLRALVGSAIDGSGGTCLVEGPPGIGKTLLLEAAAAMSIDAGMVTHSARGQVYDCRRPFATIADCLGTGTPLSGPDAGDGSPGARESHIADAVIALVEGECERGPVCLVIDDLQWADTSTIGVLGRLARAAPELPLALVVASRPVGGGALEKLADQLRAAGSEPRTLGPLSAHEIAALVADILGAAPGPRLQRQLALAGGNPLFAAELVGALRAGNELRVAGGVAEVGRVVTPPGLALTILHRVSFLPRPVLSALRASCVLGTRFAVHDLATVAGCTAASLERELDDAITAGVLRVDGDRLAFCQTAVREALYDDIALPIRSGMHRDAARALAAAGAPAAQVAEHYLRSGSLADPQAVAAVNAAAGEVAVRSPANANELLEWAMNLLPADSPDRDGIAMHRAVSLYLSGRSAEAAALLAELVARPQPPVVEARLRLCRARLLDDLGHPRDGLREAEIAVAIRGLSEAQRARALADAASLPMSIPDVACAAELAERARRAGAEARCAPAVAIAHLPLAMVALMRGQCEEALRLAEHARVVRDEEPDDRIGAGTYQVRLAAELVRSHALDILGDHCASGRALDVARSLAESGGFLALLARVHTHDAVHRFTIGDWQGALDSADALAKLTERATVRTGSLIRVAGVSALVAIHRGDLAGAARSLAMEPCRSRHPFDEVYARLAEALLVEANGDPSTALHILADLWRASTDAEIHLNTVTVGAHLVRLAVHVGDHTLATAGVASLDQAARSNPGAPALAATAWRCRSLVDRDVDAVVAAVDGGRGHLTLLDQAQAAEQAAVALATVGDVDRARKAFDEALDAYDDLGASWDSARVRAGMRSAGLRRGSRSARRGATTGWDALTGSEQGVAALVAEGLSNPEIAARLFVSRSTVKAHVSSVLAKLGVQSRVELARAFGQRQ